MKIELTDRGYWVSLVSKAIEVMTKEIDSCMEKHKATVAEYDKLPWYKKFLIEDPKCYSTYHRDRAYILSGKHKTLENALRLLQTGGTGVISVDEDELSLIQEWQP